MKEYSKVNVLGTEYTIYKDTSEIDKPFMSGADGLTDFTTKEIFIATLDDGNPDNMQAMEHYEKRTIRHEIIHATLFESGLDHNSKWGRDEEIVDWIAIQFPKLLDVFKSVDIETF
ncbi:hypothetical protein [Enterococcus casseliflavus]|uniref:hypothetical protein n=1 Tax=Enterococcus TaxID=1350 RepID=UPI0035DE6E4C